MPVYIKKVSTRDPRFSGRSIDIGVPGAGVGPLHSILVPNTTVVCDGCNVNAYPNDGYLVYLGKREMEADQPYDFYCEACVRNYFPKAVEVLGES